MTVKVTKMDKRHSASDTFSYYVTIVKGIPLEERIIKFDDIRQWCWKNWGPSCERDLYTRLYYHGHTSLNPQWCWHSDNYNEFRLYLQSDQELSWLVLRWQ